MGPSEACRLLFSGILCMFFCRVSPDGKHFISPLRINGSALESVFSVLKHTSGAIFQL